MIYIYKINGCVNRQVGIKSAIERIFKILKKNTLLISNGPVTKNIKEFQSSQAFCAFLRDFEIDEITIKYAENGDEVSILENSLMDINVNEELKRITFNTGINKYVTIQE